MKTIKYLMSIILLGIMSMICSCTESSQAMPKQGHDGFYSQVNFDKIEESSDEEAVYICTGPSSKRYHKSSDCIGLSSCSAEIERVTKSYAEELGRTPCKRCY